MLSSELSLHLGTIEKIFGTRWLHDQVQRIRDNDPRHRIGATPCNDGIHPLGRAWFKAREELIMSELTGRSSFSEDTLRTAGLGGDLLITADLDGFSVQKNRLLEQSLFREAAYEISIAAGYAELGYRVVFSAPGLIIGQNSGRVELDCFTEINDPGEAGSGLYNLLLHCPSIAYFELNPGWYGHLRENVERFKASPAGKTYSAVVLTCRGGFAGPDGTELRSESFTFVNPRPRFPLPGGFRIYSPGVTSSIS